MNIKRMSKEQGFTLIELVVVIVILGILAATALPKFVDLTGDAKLAAVQGAAGALTSAAAINYSGYLVNSAHAGVVRLDAAGAGSTLAANMASWDTSKFAFSTDATCATNSGGSTATAGVVYVGATSNSATATIICTG